MARRYVYPLPPRLFMVELTYNRRFSAAPRFKSGGHDSS
jgi:hypothetical protein